MIVTLALAALSLFMWLIGGFVLAGWLQSKTGRRWLANTIAVAMTIGSSVLSVWWSGGWEAFECRKADGSACERSDAVGYEEYS